MAKIRKAYVARDPRPLGQVVVLWLYLRIASSVFGVVSDLVQINALSRFPSDTPVSMTESLSGMETADMISGLNAFGLLATILVSSFLTLKWIYRTTMNSHTLATGLRVSPPWSIGWYFVPLANLYKPFQALSDSWSISVSPLSWKAQDTPSILRWWWGLWLVAQFIDNAGLRLQNRVKDAGMATTSAGFDLVSDLLWIPLCLTMIRVVQRLSAQQADALSTHAFD